MSNDILGPLPRALVTVPEHRLGMVLDFANKLAGPQGDLFEEEGKKFLRKEASWVPVVDIDVPVRYRLKVWKNIRVGGVERAELFRRVDRVTTMGPQTQVVVRRPEFDVSQTPRNVNLVILTPAQMGFTIPPTNEELLTESACIARSKKWLNRQALRLCDPEITLHLFLQLHTHEKENLDLWMAMKPIPSAIQGGMDVVMGIEKDCGVHFRKLRPDHRWSLSTKLVFILDELPPPPPTALPPQAAPAP